MNDSPAFQLYPKDVLGGLAATYSLEEFGAFMLLLSFDWTLSGLPIEPEKLAKLLRVSRRKFAALWAVIGEQFPESEGRRYNPLLQLQREKQAAWKAKSSEGGKASAAKRGARVVEPPLSPTGTPNGNIAIAFAKEKSSTARPAAPAAEGFERAWTIYPRRIGGNSRSDALKAWTARLSSGVAEEELVRGVERYAAFCRATGKTGTELVMQAKRFFGPGGHYAEDWTIAAAPAPENGKPRQLAATEMLL